MVIWVVLALKESLWQLLQGDKVLRPKVLQRGHVPEQCFRQHDEVVVLHSDFGDVVCTREVERAVRQAVEVASFNVAGGVSRSRHSSWQARQVATGG